MKAFMTMKLVKIGLALTATTVLWQAELAIANNQAIASSTKDYLLPTVIDSQERRNIKTKPTSPLTSGNRLSPLERLIQDSRFTAIPENFANTETIKHKLIAIDSDQAGYYRLQGFNLYAQGKLEEAIKAFRRAIELDPESTAARSGLIQALRDLGQKDAATEALYEAIQLDPNMLALMLKTQAQATEIWNYALQRNANEASTYHNLGIALARSEHWQEAIAAFSRAIELESNWALAHNNLGNVLSEMGRFQDAIAASRRAIELNPENANFYTNLGMTLAEAGQLDEAINTYRRAIELDPSLDRAYKLLGNALGERGEWEKAIETYRRIVNIPDDATAYNALGIALYQKEEFQGAIASFRRSLEFAPNNAQVYTNLGKALSDQGQLADAIASFRRALELEPNSFEAYLNLGVTLHQQGEIEDASTEFQRAVERLPEEMRSLEDLDSYTDLSIAWRQVGEFHKSIQVIRRGIQINPYIGNGASCHLLSEAMDTLDIPHQLIIRQYKSAFCDLRFTAQSPGQLEDVRDDAQETINRAIAAVPKYAQAYKNLGLEDIMLIETETLPEPTDELDNKALALANYNLGIMLLNRAMLTGDPESMEEAILSFEESIENEPNNGWTYIYLGIALTAQGRWEEAITASRQALQLPDSPGKTASTHTLANNIIGYAFEQQGKLEEAIQQYQKAIQFNPSFTPARNNLTTVQDS